MKKNIVLNGLAGAAALAGATQSYGAIVNVALPTNIVGAAPTASSTITAANTRNIDLNGDTLRDLSIRFRDFTTTGGTVLQSFIYVGSTTAAGATVGSYIPTATSNQTYAFSLATGYSVGPNAYFYQTPGYLSHIVTNYKGTNYGFTAYLGQAGVPENIGFRFTTSTGQIDYGYLRLETDPYVSAASPGGVKFLALAYENTGAAITIPTAAVPEPGTLAALAVGAASFVGLGLKRRRAAAKAE